MKIFITITISLLICFINLIYAQSLNCIEGVSINLEMDGSAILTPSLVLLDTPLDNKVISLETSTGEILIDPASSIELSCQEFGTYTYKITDLVLDVFCLGYISIADTFNICENFSNVPTDEYPITFESMLNNPIPTKVLLNGTPLQKYNGGVYGLPKSDLIDGNNILSFESAFNTGLLGTSATDLLFMKKGLFGSIMLTPLEAIASDIDRSNYLGVGDLILIRYAILGFPSLEYKHFCIHTDEDHTDLNPFDFGTDVYTFQFDKNEADQIDFKFNVYQSGDVNFSAMFTTNIDDAETRDINDKAIVTDMILEQGVSYMVPLTIDSDEDIDAIQLGLYTNGITVNTIDTELSGNQLMTHITDTSTRLQLLADASDHRFECVLHIVANRDGLLSDMLLLDNDYHQESVSNDFSIRGIELQYQQATDVNDLTTDDLNLSPNPMSETMTISIPIGYEGTSSLQVMNTQGQLLIDKNIEGTTVTISRSDLSTTGIFIVRWIYNGQTIEKSIVVI